MRRPDGPASRSFSPPGSIADPAESDVWTVVVRDEENLPLGILEWWGADCWVYASFDSVRPVEPEE